MKNIILLRKNFNEKFGLILNYELVSPALLRVFIEQIDKNSLADFQGKLQCGDQIIEINHVKINSRQQLLNIVKNNLEISLKIVRFVVKRIPMENKDIYENLLKDQIKNFTIEDFNLLNRRFLRESQKEFSENNHLAQIYDQQIFIQKEKLKSFIQMNPLKFQQKFYSKNNLSFNSTYYQSNTSFI